MDIFVTSLTRSGSSLLSNILSNHTKISAFQDPFFEIYKFFYCKLSKLKNIQDYYFSKKKQKIFKLIEKKGFDFIPMSKKDCNYLNKRIIKKSYNAKEIHGLVNDFKGENIKKYLLSAIELIKSNHKKKILCTKEAWFSELTPHLFKVNPKIKIIFLFRDPRAIICSELMYTAKFRKNKNDPIFKIYNLAKHWRKHVCLFFKYKNTPAFKKNIFFLRYEDLIENPENQLNSLFKFLKLDKKKFKLKLNFNNSFHNDKIKNKISNDNLDVWRSKLTNKQIKFLEHILIFEMNYLNYKKSTKLKENLKFSRKNYIPSFMSQVDYKNELNRFEYIRKNKSYNNQELEMMYLNSNFAKYLKKNFSKITI